MYLNIYMVAFICAMFPFCLLYPLFRGLPQIFFYIVWFIATNIAHVIVVENVQDKHKYDYNYIDVVKATLLVFSLIGMINLLIIITKYEYGIIR